MKCQCYACVNFIPIGDDEKQGREQWRFQRLRREKGQHEDEEDEDEMELRVTGGSIASFYLAGS